MKLFSISCITANIIVVFASMAFGLGPFHSHEFSSPTCTEPAKCFSCGVISSPARGHAFTEATYSTPEHCTVCQHAEGKAGYESMGEALSQLDPYEDELYSLFMELMDSRSAARNRSLVQEIKRSSSEIVPYIEKVLSVCEEYTELQACKTVALQFMEAVDIVKNNAPSYEESSSQIKVLSYCVHGVDLARLFYDLTVAYNQSTSFLRATS